MSSITTSFVVFACVFGGAILGMFLRAALPEHHLSDGSKEAVKLGMGLVATMAALVLGLLVSSAKTNYDAQSTQLTEASAKVAFLDRLLAHYGPEAKESRTLLREVVIQNLDQVWPKEQKRNVALGRPSTGAEDLLEHINQLKPKDDAQRSLQAQALNLVVALGQTRWLMYTQGTNSASRPLSSVGNGTSKRQTSSTIRRPVNRNSEISSPKQEVTIQVSLSALDSHATQTS